MTEYNLNVPIIPVQLTDYQTDTTDPRNFLKLSLLYEKIIEAIRFD